MAASFFSPSNMMSDLGTGKNNLPLQHISRSVGTESTIKFLMQSRYLRFICPAGSRQMYTRKHLMIKVIFVFRIKHASSRGSYHMALSELRLRQSSFPLHFLLCRLSFTFCTSLPPSAHNHCHSRLPCTVTDTQTHIRFVFSFTTSTDNSPLAFLIRLIHTVMSASLANKRD